MLTVSIVSMMLSLGCRGSDNNTTVDAPKSVDGPGMGSVSIKSVRMNQPTNKSPVSFSNVVVTAHVTSSKYGHIWVQDQGGGMYSGVELFCNYAGTSPSCTMTKAQLDALAIGTVVNVTGMFNSFLLSTAPAGAQPNIEIDAPMITPTGATMAAVAVDVPAATVAKAQLAAAEAEPYKGAYVHVTGGPVAVSSKTAMEFASTCTDKSMPPMTGATFNGFEAGTGTGTLAVGLGFYSTVTYCLPCTGVAMPYPCANPIATQSFTSVSGIVEPEYNANGMVYLQLSPTSDSDLVHS